MGAGNRFVGCIAIRHMSFVHYRLMCRSSGEFEMKPSQKEFVESIKEAEKINKKAGKEITRSIESDDFGSSKQKSTTRKKSKKK